MYDVDALDRVASGGSAASLRCDADAPLPIVVVEEGTVRLA